MILISTAHSIHFVEEPVFSVSVWQESVVLSRSGKIGAKIPEPNENLTMTMGNKTLVDAVFADTGCNGCYATISKVRVTLIGRS